MALPTTATVATAVSLKTSDNRRFVGDNLTCVSLLLSVLRSFQKISVNCIRSDVEIIGSCRCSSLKSPLRTIGNPLG